MSKSIYDHHRAAFSKVSAAVLMYDGEQVGNIAFKYPSDGAGRLYCYLHIHGETMVRGSAGGYGYDKKGAAFEDAISVFGACFEGNPDDDIVIHAILSCKDTGGLDWQTALKKQGIDVYIAV